MSNDNIMKQCNEALKLLEGDSNNTTSPNPDKINKQIDDLIAKSVDIKARLESMKRPKDTLHTLVDFNIISNGLNNAYIELSRYGW